MSFSREIDGNIFISASLVRRGTSRPPQRNPYTFTTCSSSLSTSHTFIYIYRHTSFSFYFLKTIFFCYHDHTVAPSYSWHFQRSISSLCNLWYIFSIKRSFFFKGDEIQILSKHAFTFPKVLVWFWSWGTFYFSHKQNFYFFISLFCCFESQKVNSLTVYLSQYHLFYHPQQKSLLHCEEKKFKTAKSKHREEREQRRRMVEWWWRAVGVGGTV